MLNSTPKKTFCYLIVFVFCAHAKAFADRPDPYDEQVVQQFDKNEIADKIEQGQQFLPNHPDSAIRIIEELFLHEAISQNDSLFAKAKYVAGTAYYFKDYYNLAIENYENALETDYGRDDESFRVRLLNNIGVFHDNLRQHDEALGYYYEALAIEQRRGDPAEMADMYINIGLVYYAIEEFEEALGNFLFARDLVEDLEVGYTRGLIQQNLGIVYREMGRHEESIQATLRAIEIFEEHEIHRSKLQSMYNLTVNYIDDNRDLDLAESISREAIEGAVEYDIPVQEAYLVTQLGRIENARGNAEAAMDYFDRADRLFNSFDDPFTSYSLDLYKSRLESFAMLGNSEGVMETFENFQNIRQKRDLANQTTAINELKLQLEVNENLARMQKQTIELQDQRAETNRFLFSTVFLGFLLFGTLGFIIYRDDKLKKLYQINRRAVKERVRRRQLSGTGRIENGSVETESSEAQTPEKIDVDVSKTEVVENGTTTENEKPDRAEKWVFKKVNELVEEEDLHKNPDLTLAELSSVVGVSSRAVSESIRYYSGSSFNNFINEFRVMDSMKLLEDESNNHLSLEAVMSECGFASRSTFYSAFDKVCGMTPNQYRKVSQREKQEYTT